VLLIVINCLIYATFLCDFSNIEYMKVLRYSSLAKHPGIYMVYFAKQTQFRKPCSRSNDFQLGLSLKFADNVAVLSIINDFPWAICVSSCNIHVYTHLVSLMRIVSHFTDIIIRG